MEMQAKNDEYIEDMLNESHCRLDSTILTMLSSNDQMVKQQTRLEVL